MTDDFREIIVDLGAISANVRQLRAAVGTAHTMAVVKANGYGHGAVPSARAALEGGVDWLGVADITEGLALRRAGIHAPILAWLHGPDENFVDAVDSGIDVGVSSLAQLEALAEAARSGPPAFAQLKVDTGLSRNGIPSADWTCVFEAAARFHRQGRLLIRGLFTHLSGASAEHDRAALRLFHRARQELASYGLSPELEHAAASGAALTLPESRLSAVRLGISIYGLSPAPSVSAREWGLRPAMTLRTRVAAVRRVPPGTGVSYDYTYRTVEASTLALVPLGYAEGIPRSASNRGPVTINGERYRVAGRVAMDQFVVDVGNAAVSAGDEVVIFGDPAEGHPSADDWAAASDTINYEIVTRLGGRAHHRYRETRV